LLEALFAHICIPDYPHDFVAVPVVQISAQIFRRRQRALSGAYVVAVTSRIARSGFRCLPTGVNREASAPYLCSVSMASDGA